MRNTALKWIDVIFLLFLGFFGILSLIEAGKYIFIWYTYPRALGIMVIISCVYAFLKYKENHNFFSHIIGKGRKIFSKNMTITSEKSFSRSGEDIMIIASFILFFLFVFSYFFGNFFLFGVYATLYSFYYIFLKLGGFHFDTFIIRSTLRDENRIKIFLISLGFYIILLSVFFKQQNIENAQNYYFIFGGIYIFVGFFLFFRTGIGVLLKKSLNAYILFTLFFVILFAVWQSRDMLLEKYFSYFSKEVQISQETPNVIEPVISDESKISEPLISDEGNINEEVIKKIPVSEKYNLTTGLELGSSGEAVSLLQESLQDLGYYVGAISGNFDELTQSSLITTLKNECGWPDSTRGIFGPLAKECLDPLLVNP